MTTETATSTDPKWRGWYRTGRRSKWVLFCQCDSEREVHDRLIDEGPRGADKTIIEGHKNPNDDRKTR